MHQPQRHPLLRSLLVVALGTAAGCTVQVVMPEVPASHPAHPDAAAAPLPEPSPLLDSYRPVAPPPEMEPMDHEAMDHGEMDHDEMDHEATGHEGMVHGEMETEEPEAADPEEPEAADPEEPEDPHRHHRPEPPPPPGAS